MTGGILSAIVSFPDAMAILSDSCCHGDIMCTGDLGMNGGMAWYITLLS